jgi:hypothetical protein
METIEHLNLRLYDEVSSHLEKIATLLELATSLEDGELKQSAERLKGSVAEQYLRQHEREILFCVLTMVGDYLNDAQDALAEWWTSQPRVTNHVAETLLATSVHSNGHEAG